MNRPNGLNSFVVKLLLVRPLMTPSKSAYTINTCSGNTISIQVLSLKFVTNTALS